MLSVLQEMSPGARLTLDEQVAVRTGSVETLLVQGLHSSASASFPHDVTISSCCCYSPPLPLPVSPPPLPRPLAPLLLFTPFSLLPPSSVAIACGCHTQSNHTVWTHTDYSIHFSVFPSIFWVETLQGAFCTHFQGHGHPIKLPLSLKPRNLV